jgi:predicted glutamine amidotransferase
MCLLIVKPAFKALNRETINNAINSTYSNPDGFGIAYIEKGRLKTYKTLKLKDFENKLFSLEGNKSPMLIHTRLATHGSISTGNCHPFTLDNQYAIAHNGVLSMKYINNKTVDTLQFIEKDLKYCIKLIDSQATIKLMEKTIGKHNKIAILNTDTQKITILNEKSGFWDGACWYSNDSYKMDDFGISQDLLAYATRWEEELFFYMDSREIEEFIIDLEIRKTLGYIPVKNQYDDFNVLENYKY